MTTLEGKVILITGSSKGIGRCIAETVGVEGAHVIAHYGSDRQGAVEATKRIPENRKILLQADLSKPEAYKKLWDEAVNWQGQIDVLIPNAAIMPEVALTESDDLWKTAWDQAIQVNSTSPAFLVREAVIHFLNNSGGNIIGISSWAAQRGSGNARLGAYASSKAVIGALLKTIARAYGKNHIYTYLIAPGIVRTAMSEKSAKSLGGEEALTATLSMGEWIPPQEIANLVAFLATGKHKQLSGSTLDVNGATYIR